MVKSSNKCFFFRFCQTLFNLAHMSAVHHEKGSVHAFFKVSFDRLFDDLASRKRNYCFGKKSGKSLEVWIQKSAQTLCYVVGETCKETLSAFHLDQTVLEVLFRNQMKWTISVWADWNSISVNFYPLVPFISNFFPVLLLCILLTSTIWERHQGISVRIRGTLHPLFLYQTEARRAEKIFFRPPSHPPPPQTTLYLRVWMSCCFVYLNPLHFRFLLTSPSS